MSKAGNSQAEQTLVSRSSPCSSEKKSIQTSIASASSSLPFHRCPAAPHSASNRVHQVDTYRRSMKTNVSTSFRRKGKIVKWEEEGSEKAHCWEGSECCSAATSHPTSRTSTLAIRAGRDETQALQQAQTLPSFLDENWDHPFPIADVVEKTFGRRVVV
jgi:hypothetical protein